MANKVFLGNLCASAFWLHRKRRWAIIGLVVLGLFALAFGRPIWHLSTVFWNDLDELTPLAQNEIDDASRLNWTSNVQQVDAPRSTEAAEVALAQLLADARQQGLKVSIAGARHSMGGHTIYPSGISINMLPFNQMELDPSQEILHVGAGALWSDVLPYLDRHGRSVGVMQSNNSFSVGGSLSVNCHGWQYGRPPIASTVESFRLMKADGSIVRCSRTENQELFSLALGGYGLFGIILDAKLKVVPNKRYLLTSYVTGASEALSTYHQKVGTRSDAAMVYARFNVDPDRFLQDVILNVYTEDPDPKAEIPALQAPGLAGIRRNIFRGSVDSAYGKQLRWTAETKLQPSLRGSAYSRNQLLNESVEVFENRRADSTDILHEYFVPLQNVSQFVERVRQIVPEASKRSFKRHRAQRGSR